MSGGGMGGGGYGSQFGRGPSPFGGMRRGPMGYGGGMNSYGAQKYGDPSAMNKPAVYQNQQQGVQLNGQGMSAEMFGANGGMKGPAMGPKPAVNMDGGKRLDLAGGDPLMQTQLNGQGMTPGVNPAWDAQPQGGKRLDLAGGDPLMQTQDPFAYGGQPQFAQTTFGNPGNQGAPPMSAPSYARDTEMPSMPSAPTGGWRIGDQRAPGYGQRGQGYGDSPFNPGMGQFGQYGPRGPGGFTGSVQNGQNFINNGAGQRTLFSPEGLNQGGNNMSLMNFLNYMNRFR